MQKYRFFQISVLILWMKWNEAQTLFTKTNYNFVQQTNCATFASGYIMQ